MKNERDYVAVVYNEQDRPFTAYPDQLARHLFNRYNIEPGSKLLDIGCGRGEFLRGFLRCGARGYGVDRSCAAATLCHDAELRSADLENEALPFEDDFFDVVFSKSVIEHFYYPERLMKEIYRVLKPGGLVITRCAPTGSLIIKFISRTTHTALLSCNRLCVISNSFMVSKISRSSVLGSCLFFGGAGVCC